MTTNLQDFSTSGLLLRLVAVTVLSVTPSFVSQLGGSEVVVHGTNFIPPTEDRLWCMFGTSGPTLATWESSSKLRCTTVATHHVGSTPVYVISNSTDTPYTSTAVLVFFASRRIAKNSEIIADYGDSYWEIATDVLLQAHRKEAAALQGSSAPGGKHGGKRKR